MPSPYVLSNAPEHAGLRDHDCALCGFEKLSRPVWIADPAGKVLSAGTHCAAVALGLLPASSSKKEATVVLRFAQADFDRQVRRAAQIEADAQHAAWQAFLDEHAGPGDMQEQFHRLGGFNKARAAFRAFQAAGT
jgi:hypothetical protein